MSAFEASSSAVLASATILCSWPVEKYARFVPTFPPLPTGECETRKSSNTGSWQVRFQVKSSVTMHVNVYYLIASGNECTGIIGNLEIKCEGTGLQSTCCILQAVSNGMTD